MGWKKRFFYYYLKTEKNITFILKISDYNFHPIRFNQPDSDAARISARRCTCTWSRTVRPSISFHLARRGIQQSGSSRWCRHFPAVPAPSWCTRTDSSRWSTSTSSRRPDRFRPTTTGRFAFRWPPSAACCPGRCWPRPAGVRGRYSCAALQSTSLWCFAGCNGADPTAPRRVSTIRQTIPNQSPSSRTWCWMWNTDFRSD